MSIPGPPCIPVTVHVSPHALQVGEHAWTATYAVCGYPATVTWAWLEPLLSWPGRLDLTIHIDPIPAAAAATLLRTQRARLEAGRRHDADHGRLDDPAVDAAAGDAADLADGVARAGTRLFATGVYLTIHAPTQADLAEACAQIRNAAAGLLLDLQPATWRQLAGWQTTLPLGVDQLQMTRILDTAALTAALPHASSDLPGPLPGQPTTTSGVLYGLNLASGGIVWWDRWTADNHNSILIARSGAGKSYLTKLDLLRNLCTGIHATVIDPEDEYTPIAQALAGTVIQLGAPNVHLNPLDPPTGDTRPDALDRHALFLHTFIETLTGASLDPLERAAVDQAVTATYTAAGITIDPATWARPAPLLRDLAAALTAHTGAGQGVAARLTPYTAGAYRHLFTEPTTTRPGGPLTVWSLRQLPHELRAAATMLALHHVWQTVDTPDPDRPPHLIIVDEAWQLLRQPSAATWLYTMAKSARKRRTGLAVITQDLTDVLASDLGRVVIANSATQLLMAQAPQNLDTITDAFTLTTTERHLLVGLRRGEALLLAGDHRAAIDVISSSTEHHLLTTTTT